MRNLFASIYAQRQITKYDPNVGGLILVDASALGFQNVTDSSGHVIYPADAFLYGGRAYTDCRKPSAHRSPARMMDDTAGRRLPPAPEGQEYMAT